MSKDPIVLKQEILRLTREYSSLVHASFRPAADPQSEEDLHYYTFPTPEEFTTFEERGHSLIDHREYLDFLSMYRSFNS